MINFLYNLMEERAHVILNCPMIGVHLYKDTSKNTFIRGVFDPVGIGSMKIGQYDPFDVKNALKLMAFYPSSAFFLGNRRINP